MRTTFLGSCLRFFCASLLWAGLCLSACHTQGIATVVDNWAPNASDVPTASSSTFSVPRYPQRQGDVKKGYAALVNNAYVSCGIPESAYRLGDWLAPNLFFGLHDDANLDGRIGAN